MPFPFSTQAILTPARDELVKAKRLAPGEHPIVARVGIGLFMRADATTPDISTVSAFKQALLSADALVFSNVAAGNYFATVLERLSISEAVKEKVTRANPSDVVSRVVQGKGNDIGVLNVAMILMDKRLKLVGPLPGEYQSYLVHAAAVANHASSPDAGRDLVRFLSSPVARLSQNFWRTAGDKGPIDCEKHPDDKGGLESMAFYRFGRAATRARIKRAKLSPR